MLILFGSENCDWCEKQKQQIDAQNLKLITTYLDHSKYRVVMKGGSIERVPTIVVYDTATNKKVVHHVGYIDSVSLLKLLESVKSK